MIDYFVSYRAAVRAKVAVVAAADPEIAPEQRSRAAESARRHLDLALWGLVPRGGGILVLVGGVVGTGKSTAAEIVADTLDGVVVSTDRVRKHRLGRQPTQRPDAALASQLYTPERKREVYEAVEARARPILASGRAAVLDGTFSRREDRRRARRLAAELGVRVFFVETHCSGEVALRRLARRSAEDGNPSDAGSERYLASASDFEKLEEWPVESRVRVRTDRGGWRETLRGIVEKLRG